MPLTPLSPPTCLGSALQLVPCQDRDPCEPEGLTPRQQGVHHQVHAAEADHPGALDQGGSTRSSQEGQMDGLLHSPLSPPFLNPKPYIPPPAADGLPHPHHGHGSCVHEEPLRAPAQVRISVGTWGSKGGLVNWLAWVPKPSSPSSPAQRC